MAAVTRYNERAYNPSWLVLLLAILAAFQVVLAIGLWLAKVPPVGIFACALGALILAYVAVALRYFDFEVDAAGIRYGWAGFGGGRIALDDVASVEVVRYPWIYGYGWRVVGRAVAYSIPFEREALLVRRRSGFFNRYYFTLKGAAAAREAIESLLPR